MLTRIRNWLAPPVFEDDEDKTNAAVVLNTLSLVVIVGVTLFVVANLLLGQEFDPLLMMIIAALIVAGSGSLVLIRLGYVRLVSLILSGMLWIGFTLPAINYGGMHDTAIVGYFLVIVLAGISAGGFALGLFTLLTVLAVLGIFAAENLGWIGATIEPPSGYNDLILLVLLLSVSAVLLRFALRRIELAYERARRNALALKASNLQLETNRDALSAQTRELERRASYLRATAEVAHEASSVLDMETLLSRVVELIARRFELYRMDIFLLDEGRQWAILRAASGEGGVQLLADDFRLRVAGEGIVAQVIRSGQLYFASDVSQDPLYLEIEPVADTRSELTLPLRARGEILGAMSVQSPELGVFGEEDMAVLQALADQVALAISNAHLFRQAQESLDAERQAYGELSRQAWQQLLQTQSDMTVLRDEQGLSRLETWLDAEVEEALRTGRVATSGDDAGNLAVPILVRGQVIGTIDAHKPGGTEGWTREQITMLEALADQLGDALEDARLYQDAQRRAAREKLIAEVTTRMRETLDVDAVLSTAAQEMRQALGLANMTIRLTPGVGSPNEE